MRIHGPEFHRSICFADTQYDECIPSRKSDAWKYCLEPLTLPEWCIHEPLVSCGPEHGFKGSGSDDPLWRRSPYLFTMSLCLCRKSEFYVFNIGFLNFVISSIAFTVFAIPADDNGQRLEITVGILLTNVAFKTYLQENLPKVPYSTSLDRYFNITILLVAFVSAEAAFPDLAQTKVVADLDFEFFFSFALAGAWICFHIYLFYSIRQRDRVTRRSLGNPLYEFVKEKSEYYRDLFDHTKLKVL